MSNIPSAQELAERVRPILGPGFFTEFQYTAAKVALDALQTRCNEIDLERFRASQAIAESQRFRRALEAAHLEFQLHEPGSMPQDCKTCAALAGVLLQ